MGVTASDLEPKKEERLMNSKKPIDHENRLTRRGFLKQSLSVAGLSIVTATGITVLRPSNALGRDKQITLAASSTTGTWYALVGIIAKGLTDNMPGYAFTCISTSGSVENVRRLHMKEIEIGCATAETAYMAIYGKKPFKTKLNISGIGAMYASYEHVIALADRNIKTMQDLKGKKVAYGLPGSTIANFNDILFRAHGLEPKKDFKPVYVGQNDSINMMKDGHVDAQAYQQTPGEPGVLDLVSSRKVTFVPLGKAAGEKINKDIPYYKSRNCPLDLYGQPGKTVPWISAKTQFCVGTWVADDFVYAVTKNLYEHALKPGQDALPGTRGWTLETSPDGCVPPIHPGAKKYYQEKGVL